MKEIEIKVNGEVVELTGFPARIIINAIVGMLKSLRGVEEVESALIQIETEVEQS
ncbi:MAG: hypothetical protein J7K66_07465 [Anaerolineaceae bacterium]|nr:hypothetical protein [Anaerolineaceae bacterium]